MERRKCLLDLDFSDLSSRPQSSLSTSIRSSSQQHSLQDSSSYLNNNTTSSTVNLPVNSISHSLNLLRTNSSIVLPHYLLHIMPSPGQLAKNLFGAGVAYFVGKNAPNVATTEDPRPWEQSAWESGESNVVGVPPSSFSLPGQGHQLRGTFLANPDQLPSPFPEDPSVSSSVVPTASDADEEHKVGAESEADESSEQVISDAFFPNVDDLPAPPIELPKSGGLHALMTATASYALGQATFGSSIGAALTDDPTGLNPICWDVPDWHNWFGERLTEMGLRDVTTGKVTVPNDDRATAGLPKDSAKYERCLEYCEPQRAHLLGPSTNCEYGCGMAAVCRPKELDKKLLPVLCRDQDGNNAVLAATLDTSRGMQAWFFWTMSSSVFALSPAAFLGHAATMSWNLRRPAAWWHGMVTLFTIAAPTVFSEGWLKPHLGQAHGVGTTRPYGTHVCEEWAGFQWVKAGEPSGHVVGSGPLHNLV